MFSYVWMHNMVKNEEILIFRHKFCSIYIAFTFRIFDEMLCNVQWVYVKRGTFVKIPLDGADVIEANFAQNSM